MEVTRHEAAMLLGSPSAPKDEDAIKSVFEEKGFKPPDDFTITSFDELILGSILLKKGKEYTAEEMADIVTISFRDLGFDVAVSETDIVSYFKALRGITPGIEERQSLVRNFPEIRARYNAACMLREGVFPQYKTDFLYIFARLIDNGDTSSDIQHKTGVYSLSLIIDIMILDLSLTFESELKREILSAVDEVDRPGDVEPYVKAIEGGEYLATTPRRMSRQVDSSINKAVSRLWLEKYEEDPGIFRVENQQYAKFAISMFCRPLGGPVKRHSGSLSRVNKWLADNYRNLGVKGDLGSVVVRISLGMDYLNLSVADIIDRGFEALKDLDDLAEV